MLRNIRYHDRPIFGQHHFKHAASAWKLTHGLAPVGFNPDTTFVGKTQQHGVGFKVFGGQARDCIETWLRRGIEDSRGSQRRQPRVLFLPIDSAGLQFSLRHSCSGTLFAYGNTAAGPRRPADDGFKKTPMPIEALPASPPTILGGSSLSERDSGRVFRFCSLPIGGVVLRHEVTCAQLPRSALSVGPAHCSGYFFAEGCPVSVHRKVIWSVTSWIFCSTPTPAE